GSDVVYGAALPRQGRQQTDGQQDKERQQGLPSHKTKPFPLVMRQDQITGTTVVLAVHPSNRHKVGELPEKQHEVDYRRPEAELARCCSPPNQWWHRTRNCSDQSAERRLPF